MPFDGAADAVGVAVAFMGAGLVFCFLGYRIRFHHELHLISGYKPERVRDTDSVARVVGTGALGLGIGTLLYGVLGVVLTRGIVYWGSYFGLLGLGLLVIHRRVQRYLNET